MQCSIAITLGRAPLVSASLIVLLCLRPQVDLQKETLINFLALEVGFPPAVQSMKEGVEGQGRNTMGFPLSLATGRGNPGLQNVQYVPRAVEWEFGEHLSVRRQT